MRTVGMKRVRFKYERQCNKRDRSECKITEANAVYFKVQGICKGSVKMRISISVGTLAFY